MQTCARARMQTEGRSDERRRLWTPNKNLKDGLPFLLKDLPVRGLVARAATVATADRYGHLLLRWRGDTPFEVVGASGPWPGPRVPVEKMMACMRMLRGELAQPTAIRARGSDAPERRTTDAQPKALGSCGSGVRTRYPSGVTPGTSPFS